MKGWKVPFAEYAKMINDNPLLPYRFDWALSGETCAVCGHWLKYVYNVFDLGDNTKAFGVIQDPDRSLREWSFNGCINPRCERGAVMAAIPFSDECKASLRRSRPTQKAVKRGTRSKAFQNKRNNKSRKRRGRPRRN